MKKTLVALAALAASGAAFAASNVTLYGGMDGSVVVSKAKGQAATVQAKSGFNSASKFGLLGTEELGGGKAVGFQLEQGFDLTTGQVGNATKASDGTTPQGAFNRESRLFVKGGFGTLSFGRFGSLASGTGSQSILTGWQFGTAWEGTGSWTSYGKGLLRVNNALSYVTPSFGGVTLHAMYSNGMYDDDENQWAKNRHYYGLGAKGAFGPVDGSLIFEATDTHPSVTPAVNPTYSVTSGLNYKLNAVTLSGIYQYAWATNKYVAASANAYKQHAFGLSAAVNVGAGVAKVGTKMVIGKNKVTQKDYQGVGVNAMYQYPLSKRTAAYGYAGYTTGQKSWKSSEAGYKAALEKNGYAVGLGLFHNF